MAVSQLVTFELCEEEFAIDIEVVNGIVKRKNYTIVKLPIASNGLEGLINLRGKAVPVYNTRKRFHYQDSHVNEDSKIIVLNYNGSLVGFIVDDVTDIFKLRDEDFEPIPQSITHNCEGYIKGVGKNNDQIIIILDLIKALSDTEKKQLQSLPGATIA
ncbi:chemotaxis protein CheW [Heliobacterium gestii]|uniref:Chemotaxis protein CheW n=1 Tax=Heliomicrobium gestii TaxID=2699 RepID=A0A845LJZ4_HELGE|nr:chemotaxis protein CheW [Heliomicrobium gestii]MBM7867459.1 purine-binding chemotaxis protein CheW [Heliomicrobium gestii]MZP43723.1 chemotaxis protein CheW [Heliomicrobium gestii]